MFSTKRISRRSIILLGVFIITVFPGHAQLMDTEKLYNKAHVGVVTILTTRGAGTGFLINSDGYILTNHHVISGITRAGSIRVRFADNVIYNVQAVIGVMDQSREDMAIIKISPVYNRVPLPILPGGEANVGAKIAVIGSPLDYHLTIVTGEVSGHQPTGPQSTYMTQISAPVNPGNSGSPVLNRNGQVVGIVTSRRETSSSGRPVAGVGFSTNATAIRNFLSRHSVRYQTGPLIYDVDLRARGELTEEEAAALAQQAIDRINNERRMDSLRIVNEIAAHRREISQQQLDGDFRRRQDSLNSVAELTRLEGQIHRQRLAESERRLRDSLASIDRKESEIARHRVERLKRKEAIRQERLKLPNRISLKVGGGAYYYQPLWSETGQEFDSNGLYVVGSSMLAYRYDIRKRGDYERGSSAGLFWTYGFLVPETLNRLAGQNRVETPDLPFNDHHAFWELELGTLFREWFRLGGGMGRQMILQDHSSSQLRYYSATLGFVMRFGLAELDLTTSTLFGGFYTEPALRANLTLNLHLKMGRW